MANRNNKLPDYKDFNKPKANRIYRPILWGIIAVFGIGYLIVYQAYSNQTATIPSDQVDLKENVPSESELNAIHFDIQLEESSEEIPLESDISNNDDSQTASDISSDSDTYTEETESKELVMYSEARCVYQEGFFYQPITDDVKDRINGLSYKSNCTVPYDDLRYVSVLYKDFDDQTQTGEIICNKAIAQDIVEIFYELYNNSYQIDKIRLVDEYNADDDLSCADNNTSCFNFRTVEGSNNLSKHARGLAIDINPFQNPYVTYPNGKERISPAGSEPYADRNSGLPHMITESDLCYKLFKQHGFTWGGHWKSLKDYQHFQKEI